MFYMAIGYQAAICKNPEFQQLPENGVRWAGGLH